MKDKKENIMATLTHPEIEIDNRKSMEPWQIESQLAEIGVPYIEISWTDRFLIAEDLQNYFAKILAGYSLLESKEEEKENPDFNKLKKWDSISLKLIRERKRYYQYNLSQEQKLLLWLIKEYKMLEKLRTNEL